MSSSYQVMKAKFEMVSFLAKNKPFGKKSAHCAFPGLVDKLSDIKVGAVPCFGAYHRQIGVYLFVCLSAIWRAMPLLLALQATL